jgi:hypothetical protein
MKSRILNPVWVSIQVHTGELKFFIILLKMTNSYTQSLAFSGHRIEVLRSPVKFLESVTWVWAGVEIIFLVKNMQP